MIVGCATNYRYVLDPDAPSARFYDGNVVHTSVEPSSAVEARIRDHFPFVMDFYTENLTEEQDIQFDPTEVYSVFVAEDLREGGNVYTVWVGRGTDPELYSAQYGQTFGGTGAVLTGGGLAYLQGATVGEAIIAENQQQASVAARRSSQRATAEETREGLLGRTTLRPGESVSGGVGFERVTYGYFREASDGGYSQMSGSLSVQDFESLISENESAVAIARMLQNTMAGDRSIIFQGAVEVVQGDPEVVLSGKVFVVFQNDIHAFDLSGDLMPDSEAIAR